MNVNIQELFDRIKNEQDVIQKARLIHYVRKNQSLRLREIAEGLGIQSSHVAHFLRLIRLPAIIIDGYYAKLVSVTHLFIIARLKNQEDMTDAYEAILTKTLSVQQTEELVRKKLFNITSSSDRLTQGEIAEFIEAIRQIDPTIKVKVTQTRIRSNILFEMNGNTAYTTELLRKLLKQWKGELPLINKRETIHELK